MTEKALSKLNETQINYCALLSSSINRARSNGDNADKERGKLRGYLECLADLGVITALELKTLYLWFFSKNRF